MPIIKENDLKNLKRPIVFVLGAGASKPYGFPLGDELKYLMLGRFKNKTHNILQKLDFDADVIKEFQESLRYSTHPNIDIFLEKKYNFRELGSYLIAITIMPLEKHEALFPQKNWYGDLFDTLDFENEEPDTSNLAIVTLNYDRSIEYFLAKNIDYNCHTDLVNFAQEKRKKIKVVHAYGSLGKYPQVTYGTKPNDINALKNAAASIKIVSDRLEDSQEFQEAQRIISQANNIIFLGFGYNERTLGALLAKTVLKGKKIYGTTYRLDQEARNYVRNYFKNQITLGERNLGCQDFLRVIGVT